MAPAVGPPSPSPCPSHHADRGHRRAGLSRGVAAVAPRTRQPPARTTPELDLPGRVQRTRHLPGPGPTPRNYRRRTVRRARTSARGYRPCPPEPWRDGGDTSTPCWPRSQLRSVANAHLHPRRSAFQRLLGRQPGRGGGSVGGAEIHGGVFAHHGHLEHVVMAVDHAGVVAVVQVCQAAAHPLHDRDRQLLPRAVG